MNRNSCNNLLKSGLLLLVSLISTFSLTAKPVLPPLFTDNMVLQQGMEAPVWGKSNPQQTVTVTGSWNNRPVHTTADADGNWKLTLPTPGAGGPYSLTISDGEQLTLSNIMIGEVWLCSGQSNMEMPLAGWGKVLNYEQEIAAANYPNIRLFQVEKTTALAPSGNMKVMGDGWLICSPQTLPEFSATAYFFARNLSDSLGNIPIGLIHSSWGGTPAEAWTSETTLAHHPDYRHFVKAMSQMPSDEAGRKAQIARQEQLFSDELLSKDRGLNKGKEQWTDNRFNDSQWPVLNAPGFWEAQGLPSFDGVVWMRKTIDLPASWKGKDLLLSLGMIDDNDKCYFNGQQIGETEGWSTARKYTIPGRLVKKGSNTITIRVYDSGGEGGIHGNDTSLYIQSGNQQLSITGEWNYQVGLSLKELQFPLIRENQPSQPASLFNGMINPLFPYALRGAIWYQGETNVGRATQYSTLFPLMIQDWRQQWGYDFPFYFVQLANFLKQQSGPENSEWAALREAQQQALKLTNTGMAVAIDIGNADDIHPKNKQEVGRRLALQAIANTYGRTINSEGPAYQNHVIKGSRLCVNFEHSTGGLKTSDGKAVRGFYIAGSDGKFHAANATISGNTVLLHHPSVRYPFHVRYGWANNPDCNLTNGINLPATPFRTDTF
ncbi:MAG: sialate O-acetylesterase [Paludibacter sp.]|nr:sialate O-acetylesterase [Paludibacter sp.]